MTFMNEQSRGGKSLDIAIMESINFLKRLNSWGLKKVIIPERLDKKVYLGRERC